MVQFVKLTQILFIVLIALLMQMYALIHSSGLFIQTQMQVKPLDMIEAKDISFQQCQEVQLFIMIFKTTLSQD